MSHGPSSEGSAAEPNMTPLLDLVLQLLMFFIMCADLKNTDRTNAAVPLPVSQTAVPQPPFGKSVWVVNIRQFHDKDFLSLLSDEKRKAEVAYFPRRFPPAPDGRQNVCIIFTAYDPLLPLTLTEFKEIWIKKKLDDVAKDDEKAKRDPKTEVLINIRAENELQYEYVWRVRNICQEASTQLRQPIKVTVGARTQKRG